MIDRDHTQTVLRLCASLLIVAGITFCYRQIVTQVNSTTVALTFLVAILGIATGWGLLEAITASVAAMLCFNFFFLPPVGTFTIADPQNWVALCAFLVTAVVASQLSASAKKRALEATRRRQEMETLYELSRGLMLLDKRSAIAEQVSHRIAQVFQMSAVALFDRQTGHVCRAGPQDVPVSDARMREVALRASAFHDPAAKLAILPLCLNRGLNRGLNREALGSLAMYGRSISDAALNAVGNLAAIAVERARAEEAAAHMEAARRNEAMKSTLLDALAHEFKTPLTSIKAAASSILDEEGPARQELVTIIGEETERLDSLVNETIRMARIEAGDLKLEKRPQAVGDLVDSTLESLRILVEDREIQIDLAANLPDAFADAELTGLTLRQLLTNALKYSNPESPIAIRACAANGFLKISVRDSGPGVPQSELARIFERYYRGADSSGRIPGTGMGLAIARDIVRAHGGEIWVESVPGQGSEFFFTLPTVEKKREAS